MIANASVPANWDTYDGVSLASFWDTHDATICPARSRGTSVERVGDTRRVWSSDANGPWSG
jgi:hypothetical protein